MKGIVRDAIIYGALALGCIVGADYVTKAVWHDALLVIGGLLLGGLCAMMVLLEIRLKARRAKNQDYIRIGDEVMPRK